MHVENEILDEHSNLFPPALPTTCYLRARSQAAPQGNDEPRKTQRTVVSFLRAVPWISLPFAQLLFRSLRASGNYYLYPERGIRELTHQIIFSCG